MAVDELGAAAVFGRMAETLGTPRFHRGVLDLVRTLYPSDFAQVYHIGRDGRAVCIDPCDTPETPAPISSSTARYATLSKAAD